MRLMERIWNWLTSTNARTPKQNHPDLYPLDVPKLSRELRLEDEARRLGQAGLPAPDAQTFSGPEKMVVQRVDKARQDYVDWAALRLGILNKDLARRNVIQAINHALQTDKEFEREASGLLTKQESLLRSLGDAARKQQAELNRFIAANALARNATYPSPSKAFFLYAFLLLMVVVEGVLNATFFAQGISSGLLGGFGYAVMLAGLNVGAAFILGKYGIRWMYHRRVGPKLIGVTSTVFAFVLMLSMGLVIAHFRDSLTAEAADPASEALKTLLISPFTLRDVFSWALFFVSIFFGTGALVDGLYTDDLYPGYGNLSRRVRTASDDYEVEFNNLRDDLGELKDRVLTALDRGLKESEAAVAVNEGLIQDKRATELRLSHALSDANNSLDALLQDFRTKNEYYRGDAPRPSYFDAPAPLKPLQLPDFNTAADKESLAAQREYVKTLQVAIQGLRASIQSSFNQQFDQLKPLGTHFPGKESV